MRMRGCDPAANGWGPRCGRVPGGRDAEAEIATLLQADRGPDVDGFRADGSNSGSGSRHA